MCVYEQECLLAVCITNTGKTTRNCIYVGHKNGIKKLPRLLNACIFRMLWHSIKTLTYSDFFFSSEEWWILFVHFSMIKLSYFRYLMLSIFLKLYFLVQIVPVSSSLPIQFTLFAHTIHHLCKESSIVSPCLYLTIVLYFLSRIWDTSNKKSSVRKKWIPHSKGKLWSFFFVKSTTDETEIKHKWTSKKKKNSDQFFFASAMAPNLNDIL